MDWQPAVFLVRTYVVRGFAGELEKLERRPEMKRRLGYFIVAAGALLAALFLACTTSFTQQVNDSEVLHSGYGNVHKLPPGGPAPRTADGHPDLSGVWFPNSAGIEVEDPDAPVDLDARLQFDPKVTPEEKPSLQPWALAKIKSMNPWELRALQTGAGLNCEPEGVPGMFLNAPLVPFAIQLVQTPGQLVQLQENLNNFRVVPINGRPHQKNPDPTYTGDAAGRWEGDTLVIDVIGLDERSKAFRGRDFEFFHSDQEHVIEHISRPSMNYLVYQVTIEDPKVLTKPWNSAPRQWSLSRNHESLLELYCTNEQDVKEFQAVQQTAEGKKAK
jgi:hypothetical protein